MTGKLHGQPEQRTAKTGKPYVTAKLRVPAGAEEVQFVRVTAFSGSACTALLALGDGDAMAVAGTLKVGVWTPQTGEARVNLDLVVGQVMTIYGLERRRKAMQAEAAPASKSTRRSAQRDVPDADDDGFGRADDDAWLRGAP